MIVCKRCEEQRDANDFYKRSARKTGKDSICKYCRTQERHETKQYFDEYREKNREALRLKSAEARKDPDNRLRASNASKAYYEKNKSDDEFRRRRAAQRAQWRKENKEKIDESNRRYREQNREKVREAQRQYRERNREALNEAHRMYKAKNPDIVDKQAQARRARWYAVEYDGWTRLEIFERDNFTCVYCGDEHPSTKDLHADHYVALAEGGTNLRENVVTACATCNLKKHTKHGDDFIRELNRKMTTGKELR